MMSVKDLFLKLLLTSGFFLVHLTVLAQSFSSDSSYYQRFPGEVTSRFYFSRKYTGVDIKDRLGEIGELNYRPNSTLNMGIGTSYHAFNLNLALGFGFLNPDVGKGDTKYLDLQVHAYPNNFAIDLFGQFYKGFHLKQEGYLTQEGENYYYRPDMKVREVGASVKYVFNGKKFSYRAAFLQTEWQKKSAGSLLVGFELYGGVAKGDSTLIPSSLMINPERDFDKMGFFEFGPNVGYAYTLVIDQHYFIMGSANGNIGLGFNNLQGDSKRTNWNVNSNYFLKGSVGYNSRRWAINANYVFSNLRLAKVDGFNNQIVTGNYRLNFIYRFLPGPKVKKALDTVNPYLYL
ncbi:DUF4421 domain-containing protein [Echinicola arenosa]|nr:DUF4421 domain-containing protein [Echinicola arenosa]